MVHDVFIVGEGVWGHVSCGQDSCTGNSEEREDGGKLKNGMKGLIAIQSKDEILTILNIVG